MFLHNGTTQHTTTSRPLNGQAPRPVLVDIKDTAAAALHHLDAICAHWLPDGTRRGHDWVARNPTRDDAHAGSFSVSLRTGGAIDHATGDKCHDIVSTIRYLEGLPTQGEAARRIADFIGTAPLDPITVPTPSATPKVMAKLPLAHPTLGRPSVTWDYNDENGALVCCVMRFATADGGKEYRPLSKVNGGWVWKAPPAPRPLYGLDMLALFPERERDVILCEGEKAADAAQRLLPDALAVASMNGAQSPTKTDWAPLAGRRVRIWPDADAAGADYAQTAAKLALEAGAESVEILDLASLGESQPQGWDAADAVEDGWKPEQLAAAAQWKAVTPRAPSTPHQTKNTQKPASHDETTPLTIVQAAIAQQPNDPGSVFEPEVIAAWDALHQTRQADYQRLRKQARGAGASVTQIDKACHRFRKMHSVKKIKTGDKFLSSTSSTSSTSKASEGVLSSTQVIPSSTSSTTPLSDAPDALLHWTEKGQRLVVASQASLTASSVLRGRFAYCTQSEMWHAFGDSHWAPLTHQATSLHEAFTRWMYPATGEVGFTPRYQDSILTLIQRANMLPLPLDSRHVIPFQNGLLDLSDRGLINITPENALTWRLPHRYQANADCPKIKQWLSQAVDGDAEMVQLLRAFMRALLLGGTYLQRFLHLVGPGGSGKSTFIRLMVALIGEGNTVSTNLKELEQNRFESANLYRKRLAIISDSDKYGGSINKLKAITGQDPLRLERKHIQQAGSFVFDGMVFLASNEALVTTDYTSGLERRRVTVNFDHRFSENEKAAFHANGGEAALQDEIPGLVNWLLDMTTEEMDRRITSPPQKIIDANDDAMRAGNPTSDWLMERCAPELGEWIQIGDKQERRDRETGRVIFDDANTKLYPNYLDWCQRNGRESLSLRRFRSVTMDMAKTLGADVLESRRKVGRGIQGLRLLKAGEEPRCWRSTSLSSAGAG